MTESESKSAAPAEGLLALDSRSDAQFKQKVQAVKARKGASLSPGVIAISHLPRTLCETHLLQYLRQFGSVTRLRLSRSKKTGGSKGLAFVEFECDEVAKIVAETMDNYLMNEKLLKCKLIPPEKVHEELFVGSCRTFKKPSFPAVSRYNKKRTAEQVERMTDRLISKENRLRMKLAEKGLDYDFPGFASQKPKKKKTDVNASVCSQDDTPVCTPSVLEKRKSARVQDEEDDEIVIKATPAPKRKGKREAGESFSEEESDEDDTDGDENEDVAEDDTDEDEQNE